MGKIVGQRKKLLDANGHQLSAHTHHIFISFWGKRKNVIWNVPSEF